MLSVMTVFPARTITRLRCIYQHSVWQSGLDSQSAPVCMEKVL